MKVGEIGGRVSASWVVLFAHVTRRGRSTDARLTTVELGLVGAARVRRLDGHVERRVDERRVAALSPPGGVVARPQSKPTPVRLRGGPRRHKCHSHGEEDDRQATTLHHLRCLHHNGLNQVLPLVRSSQQSLVSIHYAIVLGFLDKTLSCNAYFRYTSSAIKVVAQTALSSRDKVVQRRPLEFLAQAIHCSTM